MAVNADLVAAFVAAVFGGGGLFALFLKWLEARRDRPVNELVTLAEVQRQIREEVRLENAGLREEMVRMKISMLALTDIIDELLPSIHGLDEGQKARLRAANNAAKLVV
jgi:hypothetical protein